MVEIAVLWFGYEEIILSSLLLRGKTTLPGVAVAVAIAVDAFVEEFADCCSCLHCKNPCHYI